MMVVLVVLMLVLFLTNVRCEKAAVGGVGSSPNSFGGVFGLVGVLGSKPILGERVIDVRQHQQYGYVHVRSALVS